MWPVGDQRVPLSLLHKYSNQDKNTKGNFTVVCIATWPTNASKAGSDLAFTVGLQPFPRDSNDKDPGGHVG